MHCTYPSLLKPLFTPALRRASVLPPSFLIPSVSITQNTAFSTSAPTAARHPSGHDRNPLRGISALRRKGLKRRSKALSVKLSELPQPVLDPRQRSAVQVDDDHGLWEFFNRDRTALMTPMELAAHGRAWTVAELRNKDWDDLWRLWWVCAKERNRLWTFFDEHKRVGKMYGDYEAEEREKVIKKTQKSIKHVLTERWYAWENARFAAMDDPEVNLYADPEKGDVAYLPKNKDQQDALEAPNEDIQDGNGSEVRKGGGFGVPPPTGKPIDSTPTVAPS